MVDFINGVPYKFIGEFFAGGKHPGNRPAADFPQLYFQLCQLGIRREGIGQDLG